MQVLTAEVFARIAGKIAPNRHAILRLMPAISTGFLMACTSANAPTGPDLLAAVRGSDRPIGGSCMVTVAPRVHDAEDDGGCGGGGHDDDANGGTPIKRHYDLTGTCQLAHLGQAAVSGRLNLSGPFETGHTDGNGQATLMARGRLLFTAANGDQLAGRYVPIEASFSPSSNGDGGTVTFDATERFGESCEGGGHDGPGGEEHEQPVSSGRFAAALGQAALEGRLLITRTGPGGGMLWIPSGRLSY